MRIAAGIAAFPSFISSLERFTIRLAYEENF